MRPHIADLAAVAPALTCAYPNAGLPDAFGQYDEGPDETARQIAEFAREGLVNVVGCCRGTTPDHLRAMRAALETRPPGDRPSLEQIAATLGGFSSASDGTGEPGPVRERRGRRR